MCVKILGISKKTGCDSSQLARGCGFSASLKMTKGGGGGGWLV